MAVEAVIENAERINNKLTLNGTVKRGDVIAHNGTGWVQADASDAVTNLYAQYIAMESGESGAIIPGCKSCVLVDADAPYTANATQYVSATAGAITETRPTTNGDVIQVIGRSSDTKSVNIDIRAPREVEEKLLSVLNLQNSVFEVHVADGTTNEWAGADVDAAAVGAVFVGRMPAGMVGAPLAADLIVDSQAGTALDLDFTYVAAYDGTANTGDAGATQTGVTTTTTTTNDTIHKASCVTGMDADFAKAGINFGVAVDPDAGDFIPLFLYMRYLVV